MTTDGHPPDLRDAAQRTPTPEAAPGDAVRAVERTGIALVHRGELILPSDGSEATLALAQQDVRTTVRIELPVEVEIVDMSPRQRDALAQELFGAFRRALEARSEEV